MEEEASIKARREYMRNYYLANKDRYKKGIYIPKKSNPTFSIVKKDVVIIFE